MYKTELLLVSGIIDETNPPVGPAKSPGFDVLQPNLLEDSPLFLR